MKKVKTEVPPEVYYSCTVRYSSVYTQLYQLCSSTCIQRDILKRYLLSRNALRLLKIIEPYLVEPERMANAQLSRYGSEHLGQNFFFDCVCLDRSFPEEPSLPRTGHFKTVATIQLVGCVPISAVPTSNG
jgi:hypothetical protein